MKCGKMTGNLEEQMVKDFEDELFEESIAAGYLEMSRINLRLAELGIDVDNEAMELCEQNLRSVNECGS